MPPTNGQSPLILLGKLSFERDRMRRTSKPIYGGNRLIASATQNIFRRQIPLLDGDIHRNVSAFGRRTLMSLGRHIFWSYEPVRQAVTETAEYASSSYQPEYRGQNMEWKEQLENLLWGHDQWCDIAGPPYSMRTYRRSLVASCMTDGDMATVYVTDPETGLPYLQTIPGHRIRGEGNAGIVNGGEYDGARIIDGVIVGDHLQAIAYRVLLGEGHDEDDYVDIPAHSMCLHFIPHFPGQLRGFSAIGLAAWSIQDVSDSRKYELLAQKAGAGRVFQEYNEEGEPPPGADHITAPTTTDTSATPSGLWFETIGQGINTYFKANSGSRLEAVKFDRPSSNQQAFTSGVMREILGSLGTSYDFVLDPTKVGGHASRVLLEKINRNLTALQDMVLCPAARRFDAFRIASFMSEKVAMLPMQDDWHRIEYQPPPAWSGDRRHDSDTDLQELRAGVRPLSSVTNKRTGENWMDVRDQKQKEVSDLFRRAKELAKEHGISVPMALSYLEDAGSPSAATADQVGDGDGMNGEGEPTEGADGIAELKTKMDAYGVGVRAGAITPTAADEEHFRAAAGLPPLSSEGAGAWREDGGVRRPITLVQKGGAPGPQQMNQPQGEEDDAE